MGDLESVLPEDLKEKAVSSGRELVLPYQEALSAIGIASEHCIAVLGLEAFEVQKHCLLTVGLVDPSSYISFSGDWGGYVAMINAEAERWIKEHRLGENHGYILSSTSKAEFAMLPSRLK